MDSVIPGKSKGRPKTEQGDLPKAFWAFSFVRQAEKGYRSSRIILNVVGTFSTLRVRPNAKKSRIVEIHSVYGSTAKRLQGPIFYEYKNSGRQTAAQGKLVRGET